MTPPSRREALAEAQLIRLAREAAGLSIETAAARMQASGIRSSRWRQIEAGTRSDTGRPVIAKAPTLAYMALAVGLTSDRLEAAGREDAAALLREIEAQSQLRRSSSQRVDDRWRMIEAVLSTSYEGLTEEEYRDLVHRLDEHMRNHPDWDPGSGTRPNLPRHPASGE